MVVVLLYMAIVAVLFFVLVVRPQRRRLAIRQSLIASLEIGDDVITAGGIYGTVVAFDDEAMQLSIAPGVEVTVAREAVASRRIVEVPPTNAEQG